MPFEKGNAFFDAQAPLRDSSHDDHQIDIPFDEPSDNWSMNERALHDRLTCPHTSYEQLSQGIVTVQLGNDVCGLFLGQDNVLHVSRQPIGKPKKTIANLPEPIRAHASEIRTALKNARKNDQAA